MPTTMQTIVLEALETAVRDYGSLLVEMEYGNAGIVAIVPTGTLTPVNATRFTFATDYFDFKAVDGSPVAYFSLRSTDRTVEDAVQSIGLHLLVDVEPPA